MITRIIYSFEALSAIHTGSDESYGILKTFRREKVGLSEPIKYKSNFKTDDGRRLAIVDLMLCVWSNIDLEKITGKRLMGIYDEFASKLLAATRVRTKQQFLTELAKAWGIRSFKNDNLLKITDSFNDDELLQTIRNEIQYLILMFRAAKEQMKLKKDLGPSLFDVAEKTEKDSNIKFIKYFEMVPVISGNSIRGICRDLVMYDFLQRVGVTKVEKNMYHTLFTGGTLSDSTGFEDIEKRELIISMCPMLGLLGSCIGNMTIEGSLKVGAARPQCLELGTGSLSFWESLSTEFGTRSDDSKTEKNIEIIEKEKEYPTTQMKYEYEVMIKGSKFNHGFALVSDNDLEISAFWHMLNLFKNSGLNKNAHVGAMGAIGLGNVEVDYKIPVEGNKKYIKYLEENKQKIQVYFNGN